MKQVNKKVSICGRYWSERRDVIVSTLMSASILGLLVVLGYLIYVATHTVTHIYWEYCVIPIVLLAVTILIPSSKLLEEMFTVADIECPLE